MRFLIKTGREEEGTHLTHVETNALETDSYCARTNRRKIRVWLVRVHNVEPKFVKWAMKELGFHAPERIGIPNYADRQAAIAYERAQRAAAENA